MTIDQKDVPDLTEWAIAHDVDPTYPQELDDFQTFVRGWRWGLGLSAVFWVAFAAGVVSC